MNTKRIYKTGILIGVIGIILLLAVIFSKVSYPNIIFRVFIPMGLLFVFLGLIIYVGGLILIIKEAWERKDYKKVKDIIFTIVIFGIILLIKNIFFK